MSGRSSRRMQGLPSALIIALVALNSTMAPVLCGGGTSISLQVFEVELYEGSADACLIHHASLAGDPGWTGQLNFVYPYGSPRIFRSPEEILDWERKIAIETTGCETRHSSDVSDEETIITVDVLNASAEFDIFVRMTLVGLVEEVKSPSIPMISRESTRKRLSLVTARADVPIGVTRVVIHLPADEVPARYLPAENVTVLPGAGDRQSVFWSFESPSANEARVYLEYGTKGRIGRVMILILVAAIMGVILAGMKLLLMLDEESLTY